MKKDFDISLTIENTYSRHYGLIKYIKKLIKKKILEISPEWKEIISHFLPKFGYFQSLDVITKETWKKKKMEKLKKNGRDLAKLQTSF